MSWNLCSTIFLPQFILFQWKLNSNIAYLIPGYINFLIQVDWLKTLIIGYPDCVTKIFSSAFLFL